MVVNGEVGSEDLAEVSPLGEEDDHESCQGGLSVRCDPGRDDLLLAATSTSFFRDFTQREQGASKEDAGATRPSIAREANQGDPCSPGR